MIRLTILAFLLLLSHPGTTAEDADTHGELYGNYLYKISTVRAARGRFEELLDWCGQLQQEGYYTASGEMPPMIMRHSQGDQWDLMIITPMAAWQDYYRDERLQTRAAAAAEYTDLLQRADELIAFDEDVFAFGPSPKVLYTAYENSGLFHIEMFHAAAGKTDELFKQRQMENDYLAQTGQVQNTIFRRVAGSDVDVFTIGFHASLASFAAPAPASDADKERAAVAAGFKNRADLSFYLRSLLSAHHDTLAVKAL